MAVLVRTDSFLLLAGGIPNTASAEAPASHTDRPHPAERFTTHFSVFHQSAVSQHGFSIDTVVDHMQLGRSTQPVGPYAGAAYISEEITEATTTPPMEPMALVSFAAEIGSGGSIRLEWGPPPSRRSLLLDETTVSLAVTDEVGGSVDQRRPMERRPHHDVQITDSVAVSASTSTG